MVFRRPGTMTRTPATFRLFLLGKGIEHMAALKHRQNRGYGLRPRRRTNAMEEVSNIKLLLTEKILPTPTRDPLQKVNRETAFPRDPIPGPSTKGGPDYLRQAMRVPDDITPPCSGERINWGQSDPQALPPCPGEKAKSRRIMACTITSIMVGRRDPRQLQMINNTKPVAPWPGTAVPGQRNRRR